MCKTDLGRKRQRNNRYSWKSSRTWSVASPEVDARVVPLWLIVSRWTRISLTSLFSWETAKRGECVCWAAEQWERACLEACKRPSFMFGSGTFYPGDHQQDQQQQQHYGVRDKRQESLRTCKQSRTVWCVQSARLKYLHQTEDEVLPVRRITLGWKPTELTSGDVNCW